MLDRDFLSEDESDLKRRRPREPHPLAGIRSWLCLPTANELD